MDRIVQRLHGFGTVCALDTSLPGHQLCRLNHHIKDLQHERNEGFRRPLGASYSAEKALRWPGHLQSWSTVQPDGRFEIITVHLLYQGIQLLQDG